MNFRRKYIMLMLFGIYLLFASVFDTNIYFRTVFLIIGVINISVCTNAISLYNYNKGYYKEDLND